MNVGASAGLTVAVAVDGPGSKVSPPPVGGLDVEGGCGAKADGRADPIAAPSDPTDAMVFLYSQATAPDSEIIGPELK